jgi:histidyl-tRNA synthetase
MSDRIKAPRGTFDVLPEQQAVRARIHETARSLLHAAGFARIDTPVFEETELFARGVGEATEVVQKQMFSFSDQGHRSLTLRPEGTASICRAYVEHGMQKRPQPVKLWTSGAFFRHERPQAGRYRQFHQVDAETIGSASPLVDAELIVLAWELIGELGVEGVTLRLGSLGSPAARAAYVERLRDFMRGREGELAAEVRERIELNPLRAFDSADPGTQAVMAEAPRLLDGLDEDDARHFEQVRTLLDRAGVSYEVDATLVRGLDYYTRTVFELHCGRLGAQSQVGGGGRYDGLISQLGGPETPAMGWAVGVDRLALALDEPGQSPRVDVFIVAEEDDRERALALALEMRHAGISADLDLAERSHKGQMKQADRSGAAYAVLLEGGDAHLRDMRSGETADTELGTLVDRLREGLAAGGGDA